MNSIAPRRTSTLAIISLVAGIAGLFPLPVLGSIVAIVTGHLARGEIRREPDMEGDGMAVAGLVLGYGSLLLALSAVAMLLLFFGGMLWLSNVAG